MANCGDLASFDAATSRSSAKRVASVVSKFCDLKRKLVCDIGFGGILHIPQINKTPRKFTVWLLSKVDIPSRSIVVNGMCKVKLNDIAFHRVLGIPWGPKKLIGLETNELQDKLDFIKLALGSINTDPLETCSLKVAEDIVTMEYSDGMSKEQLDRFKVSFVVFVIGHFLIAKTKSNHGMEEYWGSLLNTDEIHLHNFCSIVIDEIIESAKRVQDELRCNRVIKNVTGCTLGLQILYLDSLKLYDFQLPQERLPRIALFDLVLLKKMINSDQENNISYCASDNSAKVSTTETTGKSNVRFKDELVSASRQDYTEMNNVLFTTPQPAVSTYLTAYLRGSVGQKLTSGQVDALKWHNARMTYHVRQTKEILFKGVEFTSNLDGFKSLVEVHMEALMAKIFQDNLSLAQRLHTHVFKQNIQSEQFVKGSNSLNGSSSFYLRKNEGEGSVAGKQNGGLGTFSSDVSGYGNVVTPLVGKKLFNSDSIPKAKRVKKENVMSSSDTILDAGEDKRLFEPFLLSEDAVNTIIDHGCEMDVEITKMSAMPSIVKKLKCKQKRIAPSPWIVSPPRKTVPASVANALYDWLENNNLSTLRSNWIMHALPKYIQLDGYVLKDIFVNRKAFTSEAFDIAIRRITQLDSFMYGTGRKVCWRHVMESDFAMMVLGNMDPLESLSIINQFTMRFNDYDISECRMIVVPAIVNLTWCAYYWDMEELKVHVIDPMYDISRANSTGALHRKNIGRIQKCLAKIMILLFEGWNVNFSEFNTNFVKPIMSGPQSGSDGILTLLAIQEFDGSKFVESQNEESVDAFRKLVLYEMVSLEDNYGKAPPGFIQLIM